MTDETLRQRPIAHRLELLEGNKWDPDLILGSSVAITPRVQVFGQLVKIALMDREKVRQRLKTVLV